MAKLCEIGLAVDRSSRLFATPCFPAGAGPDYVNGVASLLPPPDWSPADILSALHQTEAVFGRTREKRWAGRTLDLDLLAIGDLVLPDAATHAHWRNLAPADQARLVPDRLILPHPRLQDRAFVLVPFADVAPDWCHPVSGKSVARMRDALPQADLAAVRALPVDSPKPG